MIEIKIPTNHQKLCVNFDIEFAQPFDLWATGVDASNKKTVFFNRLINPGSKFFNIDCTLPVSPKNLLVTFGNQYNNDNLYKIVAIGIDQLQNRGVELSQFDYNNIEWLKKFALDASYLPDGKYYSPQGAIWINYMPEIIDENGIVLDTPARVNHDTGEMQINSTKYKTYTVPERMYVNVHEYSHWANDNTDETFCDLESLRINLGLGFPKTEAIYAFTGILSETHENKRRVKQIVNYIHNY